MLIYKNFTQAQLDAEYDNSRREPRLPAIIQDWRERSARLRSRTVHRRYAYGKDPRETLTVFPCGQSLAPIWLFFHGGYWMRMEDESFHFLGESLLRAGVTCIFVNYPLAPCAALGQLVSSARAAAAWALAHAAEHDGDPARVYVAGHSAGGHLATMLLTQEWAAAPAQQRRCPFAGLLAISGLFDLLPIQKSFLNERLQLSDWEVQALSPVRLPPRVAAPLLLTVGALESSEFHAQSDALLAAWSGAAICRHIAAGRDHFSVLEDVAAPDGALHQALLDQMAVAAPPKPYS